MSEAMERTRVHRGNEGRALEYAVADAVLFDGDPDSDLAKLSDRIAAELRSIARLAQAARDDLELVTRVALAEAVPAVADSGAGLNAILSTPEIELDVTRIAIRDRSRVLLELIDAAESRKRAALCVELEVVSRARKRLTAELASVRDALATHDGAALASRRPALEARVAALLAELRTTVPRAPVEPATLALVVPLDAPRGMPASLGRLTAPRGMRSADVELRRGAPAAVRWGGCLRLRLALRSSRPADPTSEDADADGNALTVSVLAGLCWASAHLSTAAPLAPPLACSVSPLVGADAVELRILVPEGPMMHGARVVIQCITVAGQPVAVDGGRLTSSVVQGGLRAPLSVPLAPAFRTLSATTPAVDPCGLVYVPVGRGLLQGFLASGATVISGEYRALAGAPESPTGRSQQKFFPATDTPPPRASWNAAAAAFDEASGLLLLTDRTPGALVAVDGHTAAWSATVPGVGVGPQSYYGLAVLSKEVSRRDLVEC